MINSHWKFMNIYILLHFSRSKTEVIFRINVIWMSRKVRWKILWRRIKMYWEKSYYFQCNKWQAYQIEYMKILKCQYAKQFENQLKWCAVWIPNESKRIEWMKWKLCYAMHSHSCISSKFKRLIHSFIHSFDGWLKPLLHQRKLHSDYIQFHTNAHAIYFAFTVNSFLFHWNLG